MENKYSSIFTPFHIGKCEIKNRVVLCAMEGTAIVDAMAKPHYNNKVHDYYIERAKNDVGLMIPGMLPVRSMIMDKWAYEYPKVFEEAKPLLDEIHSYGSKVFFQIGTGFGGRNFTLAKQMTALIDNKFLGRVGKGIMNMDHLMISASDNMPNVWMPEYTCRALTKEEIREYIDAFGKTAKLAKNIGVDGVEVHAVHEGYLLDQFATAYTNKRTDEYGGSLENRLRFACEIVKAIKKECG